MQQWPWRVPTLVTGRGEVRGKNRETKSSRRRKWIHTLFHDERERENALSYMPHSCTCIIASALHFGSNMEQAGRYQDLRGAQFCMCLVATLSQIATTPDSYLRAAKPEMIRGRSSVLYRLLYHCGNHKYTEVLSPLLHSSIEDGSILGVWLPSNGPGPQSLRMKKGAGPGQVSWRGRQDWSGDAE